MRRVFAVLYASVLVAMVACSGSGDLVGPAPDAGSRATLANGQDPVSNNGTTAVLQGQDPVSNNGTRTLRGPESASGITLGLTKRGQEPSSNN